MAFAVLGLLSVFMALDIFWWRAADRWLRLLGGSARWRWISALSRIALAVFMTAVAGYLIASRLVLRSLGGSEGPLPIRFHVLVYFWHFLILPAAMIWLLIAAVGRRMARRVRRGKMIAPGKLRKHEGEESGSHSVGCHGQAYSLARGAETSAGKHGQANTLAHGTQREHENAVVPPRSPSTPRAAATSISTSLPATNRITHQSPLARTAPSRRQIMAAAAMAIPPLAAAAAAGSGSQQVKDLTIDWATGTVRTNYGYRLRHFDVRIPQLPPALDGMTIAHLSDTHIGKFLHRDRLPAIADDVNKLDADFVVFTGDLIDVTLNDLPFGIDFLRSIKPRCGMAVCEGNHDIIEGDEAFENRMHNADVGFILDDQSTKTYVSRNGRSFPVQFLAIPWVRTSDERSLAVRDLSPFSNADAFRILLAHHPHAFDPAAAAGFPLVLSGHTHGGQIMFNETTGIGSARFRYISGQYTKSKPGSTQPDCNLVVNNGLGNWFPLRINAPAEIVHLTLKRDA